MLEKLKGVAIATAGVLIGIVIIGVNVAWVAFVAYVFYLIATR